MSPPECYHRSVSNSVRLCRFIGLWPSQKWATRTNLAYNCYSIVVLTMDTVLILLQLRHLLRNIDNLMDVAESCYIFLSTVTALVKAAIVWRHSSDFDTITRYLRLGHFNQERGRHKEEKLTNLSVWLFRLYLWLISITFVLRLVFYSILGNRSFVLQGNNPFQSGHTVDAIGLIGFSLEVAAVLHVSLVAVAVDSLLIILLVQICHQCDVLVDTISCELGDAKEFKKCIRHHQLIIKWSQEILKGFNTILFVQISLSAVIVCNTLFMLHLTRDNQATLTLLSYQVVIACQNFLFCWFGNEVTLKSANIFDCLCVISWYELPLKAKKDLVFLLMRTRRPIVLHVGGMLPLDLSTFKAIIKSSWAYFTAMTNANASSAKVKNRI